MPNPILVPVGGRQSPDRALLIGAALARHAEAELLVLHAAPDPEHAAQRQVELKDALVRLRLVGDVMTRWGRAPAEAISEVVSADPASVVCMTTGAPGRVGGTLLGSTAEDVLRRGCGPMMLIGPKVRARREWDWEELAVCVDSSPASEAALPFAAEWGDAMAMRLRVLHVLNPATTRELRLSYPELQFRDDSYAHGVALELGSTWETNADVELLYSARPAAAITQYLEAYPETLPFLGTHGRTGLSRMVMGSVATRVVHNSPSPAVVVCPTAAR